MLISLVHIFYLSIDSFCLIILPTHWRWRYQSNAWYEPFLQCLWKCGQSSKDIVKCCGLLNTWQMECSPQTSSVWSSPQTFVGKSSLFRFRQPIWFNSGKALILIHCWSGNFDSLSSSKWDLIGTVLPVQQRIPIKISRTSLEFETFPA